MHTKGSFHSHESFLRTKIAHAAAPKSLADGRWLFASSCSSLQFPSASIYWAHTLSPCARLCDGFKIKGTLVSDCKIGPWLQMIFNLTCWMEQVTKMRPWGHEVPPTSCDKRALKKMMKIMLLLCEKVFLQTSLPTVCFLSRENKNVSGSHLSTAFWVQTSGKL